VTARCARCGNRTSDPVTITNGATTVTVCRDDVPRSMVPAGTRLVTVSR
jgi:hypothetical protein